MIIKNKVNNLRKLNNQKIKIIKQIKVKKQFFKFKNNLKKKQVG